jgi:hypothetical protein
MIMSQNDLMRNDQGQQAFNQLMANQGGPTNVGRMYENIVGGAGNTYIDPMVDAMRGDYSDILQRDILPSLDVNAVNAGQLGGSRDALAKATATAEIGQDFARDAVNLRGGAYDTDLNWKMDIARMADQNQQLNQDRLYNMWDQSGVNQAGALDRQGGFGNNADLSTQWGVGNTGAMQDSAQAKMNMYQNAGMFPWLPMQYMSQMQNQYSPNITESGSGYGTAENFANSRYNSGGGGFSFL